jgi:hypothetical protein
MDKIKADRDAVKLSLQQLGKESILGIFGDEDAEQMIGKMFAVIDMAAHLRITGVTISVSLEELIQARIEYLKQVNGEENDA